jgi:hypothetical protein
MSAQNGLHQTKIVIGDEPQLDKDLQFLGRFCKFSLLIFRSNCEKPKISVPKLIFAVVLLLLGKFVAV